MESILTTAENGPPRLLQRQCSQSERLGVSELRMWPTPRAGDRDSSRPNGKGGKVLSEEACKESVGFNFRQPSDTQLLNFKNQNKLNVDTTKKPFTVVEGCAGYSGISLGLKRVIPNLRVIAVSEVEYFAAVNLAAKMEAGCLDAAPNWTNLKTFPFREFFGLVDLFTAGFPCQPFSCAGLQRATEDPRHLYPFIAGGVSAMQPRYVLLENVEGLLTAKTIAHRPDLLGHIKELREAEEGAEDGRTRWRMGRCAERTYEYFLKKFGESVLWYVLRDLESRGYTTTWGIFSAAEVRAPHGRKRVFILGKLANSIDEGPQGRLHGREDSERGSLDGHAGRSGSGVLSGRSFEQQLWPSRPGQPQFSFEPPRVTGGGKLADTSRELLDGSRDGGQSRGNEFADEGCGGLLADSESGTRLREAQGPSGHAAQQNEGDEFDGQIKQPLVRDTYGNSNRLDYAKLCVSSDSRVDELRLLGNGVVPATAALAWVTLYARLMADGDSSRRPQSQRGVEA